MDLFDGINDLVIFLSVYFIVKVGYQHKPALLCQSRKLEFLLYCHKPVSVYHPDCKKRSSHYDNGKNTYS